MIRIETIGHSSGEMFVWIHPRKSRCWNESQCNDAPLLERQLEPLRQLLQPCLFGDRIWNGQCGQRNKQCRDIGRFMIGWIAKMKLPEEDIQPVSIGHCSVRRHNRQCRRIVDRSISVDVSKISSMLQFLFSRLAVLRSLSVSDHLDDHLS